MCSTFLLISIGIVLVSSVIVYDKTLKIEIAKLRAISQSHAALIESVAVFDAATGPDLLGGSPRDATLSQITAANLQAIGFGNSGEIVIGEAKETEIHFLIPSRVLGGAIPPVELTATTAEPMRRALSGKSGKMFAQDYQGVEVLAWYEPLPRLDAGLVAKINIFEIRGPFIRALFIGTFVAIAVSVFATASFVLISIQINQRKRHRAGTKHGLSNKALVLITFTTCLLLAGGASIGSVINALYSPGLERQKSELSSLSEGMASLIDSVAEFDARTFGDSARARAIDATISQVQQAARTQDGFGQSGEIVLGVLMGSDIHFMLPSRFTGSLPESVDFNGNKAEPMRRALAGEAGVIEVLDYRGENVAAAFHPVEELEAGFVAKMDMQEIRSPYTIAGVISASLAIFFVLLGVLLAPQLIPARLYPEKAEAHIGISSSNLVANTNTQAWFGVFTIIAMAALVLQLDYLTPLGIAAGIPYIALIIITSFFTEKKGIVIFTLLFTILILIGWAIAPSVGSEFYKVLVNRLYSILTLWLAAIIILQIKRVEGTVRQSEQQLFSILESAPDATLIVANDGKILFANHQAESIFGYKKLEFLKLNVDQLVPKDVAPRHSALRATFVKSQHARSMGQGLDLSALKSDGSSFPVEISLSPIETANGVLTAASIRDISERKNAQMEIIRKEAELRMAMENMPGAMIVVDPNMKIAAVNSKYKEFYGDPDGIVRPGSSMVDVLKSEFSRGILKGSGDKDAIFEERVKSFKPDELVTFEDITQDGRYLQLSRVPAPNDHTVTVAVDITERKRSEQIIANAMTLINESIQYASRIQRSVLPTAEELGDAFEDHMVIWEPKDIVGGDIYLYRKCESGILIMLLDCTGHGVPGAFMTMIATGAFDQALLENPKGSPADLLKRTNQIVKNILSQTGKDGESDDGFECGICLIASDSQSITFAGARFELWVVDSQEIKSIKGDKAGIGYRRTDINRAFTNHTLTASAEASYYMSSDGIIDQIGGPKRISFGKKRLKQLILDYSRMSMNVQATHIIRAFEEYQHTEERRDDVTLIGFKPKL